jgi:glycerophosphoryl diester phosphodiesterase
LSVSDALELNSLSRVCRRPAADLLDRVIDHGHLFVHPYDTMVEETFVHEARTRRVQLNVWFDKTDSARLRTLVDLGVDGLISKQVVEARRAVDRDRNRRDTGR